MDDHTEGYSVEKGRSTEGRRSIEIKEALAAAQEALESLRRVERCLRSAGNWGIWDLLGGGLISSFLKHSRLGDAEREMEQAKYAVKNLQKELGDITDIPDLHIQVGDFLKFADFFFDGLIADWMVQSRIRETQGQVKAAIAKVEQVIERLHTLSAAGA
ncbi:MAG: hypothetical protein LBQ15_08080 [Clostridium sp.]|jgi:hypothetical protein|nr:hypothetical protein [Clostridium sp.]